MGETAAGKGWIAILRNPDFSNPGAVEQVAEAQVGMLKFHQCLDGIRVISSTGQSAKRAAEMYARKIGAHAETDERLYMKNQKPPAATIDWMEKVAGESNVLFVTHNPLASLFLPFVMCKARVVPYVMRIVIRKGDLLVGNPFERALLCYQAVGGCENYLPT